MRWAAATVVAWLALASPALAELPYHAQRSEVPSDLGEQEWKLAATAEPGSPYQGNPMELYGVRGAHVVDAADVDTAWQVTTGRTDVTIAVLDSGIKWNDAGAMEDLRRKVRLNEGELPRPDGCTVYDCNDDGVVNVDDYADDPRVEAADPRRVGPPGVITPQDLLIAFSDGTDADGNGFADDIAGWDFLDDDNDAFDDVQYGHGTGEARDSSAEANNGGEVGTCPNCLFIPLRVGDSFIADANRFARAVLYATDNGVLVVQEALGTLNNTRLARRAVAYAYRHGVAVIASAADEAAQHHNWPSNYPHTIVVNSVNRYKTEVTPANPSYLQFNGCTNFSTHVTLAIPSSSCSSNATGNAAGFAGLVYSAALDAVQAGELERHPGCVRTGGRACVITANEVRQLMASGIVGARGQADDVNFASCPPAGSGPPQTACAAEPEPSCAARTPGCTDPNSLFALTTAKRPVASPVATTRSYPARRGFDEFYGYGRANMVKAVDATVRGRIPPEAEITGPDWYAAIDPGRRSLAVLGAVFARGASYSCRVEVAPGSEPNNATVAAGGDFERVASDWCDGSARSRRFDGVLATIDVEHLKERFPFDAGDFRGREPPPAAPNFNNRPNQEPYGFTVRVIVTRGTGASTLIGQDRRNLYLHRDRDTLAGWPRKLPSDGASPPALADLDGDGRNELVLATGDGLVHALRRGGGELPGWPVHSDALPFLHPAGRAFASGEVPSDSSYGSILASVAVGDLERDGHPEVVAADFEGRVYAWSHTGARLWAREADPSFSGRPLQPFANVRYVRADPEASQTRRTQHGFIASPVLADLDGAGGPLEVVAAGMDRHVYAWTAAGAGRPGFPVLVADRTKVAAIDPTTHALTFEPGVGADLQQGPIVDTPAVADIAGDAGREIVVGTNEEYSAEQDGGLNAGNLNTASFSLLANIPDSPFKTANGRLYALDSQGRTLDGWPAKVGILLAELLPVVGEGITGSPVVAPLTCPSGGPGQKVGVIPGAGPGYVFNADGTSCYGSAGGHDNALQSDFAAGNGKFDTPAIPTVGQPAFGTLPGGTAFLAPASGLIRALDVAANEYQGGQDFLAAWDGTSGQFRPGFPSPVADLQFLTGPSVGDVNGQPGEEVVGGTSSLDLNALDATGGPASAAWPKFTTDWTVANPVIGTFGTRAGDSAARKVVVEVTRSGYVFVYRTPAAADAPASWPRFHHDNANSGWLAHDVP